MTVEIAKGRLSRQVHSKKIAKGRPSRQVHSSSTAQPDKRFGVLSRTNGYLIPR